MPSTHEVSGHVAAMSTSAPANVTAQGQAVGVIAGASAPPHSTPHPSIAGVDTEQPPAGGRLVGLILGVLIVSTIAMVAFIWYRWHDVHEPTTAIMGCASAAIVPRTAISGGASSIIRSRTG